MVLETNGALYTRTAHLWTYERPEEYDGHDGREIRTAEDQSFGFLTFQD